MAEPSSPLNASPADGFRLLAGGGKDSTVHIGRDDLPWLMSEDGTELQVLHVDLNVGLWVLRVRWPPGCAVATHYHTGQVFAVTHSGCWYYREYPETRNTAGSYLYEPAHAVHTLVVPEDNTEVTEVWFAIYGANIDIDADGKVMGVLDARTVLAAYRNGCAQTGADCSKTLVMGE
ncbi:MAG: 2,4'-dihydroxyacetophenone dioxygenase family protein [Gammaproteobacteria bacterium]|nr:2,4'-dihydroxyacetophenone dioxygenase family protein [Gammaproteobacteria bacterium]